MKPFYRGLSLANFSKNKSMVLTDIDLIRRDVTNHIFTRKGERVKMPEFGSIIPDMVFEPLDEESVFAIKFDIEEVMSYEPRIEVIDIQVIPYYDLNTVLVRIFGNFIELNLNDVLDIYIEFK